jgi:hypothetical protein
MNRRSNREVLLEFTRVGRCIRATAMDPETAHGSVGYGAGGRQSGTAEADCNGKVGLCAGQKSVRYNALRDVHASRQATPRQNNGSGLSPCNKSDPDAVKTPCGGSAGWKNGRDRSFWRIPTAERRNSAPPSDNPPAIPTWNGIRPASSRMLTANGA